MNNILERLKNRQTRDSTAKNYIGIWRQLNKFIIKLDYKDNLSWEEKTALFGAYLVDGGVQSSTLKSYFSAIKFILKQDRYEWKDSKLLLSSLIRGCKLENDKLKVRLPIQKGLLEMILFEVERKFDHLNPQPYLAAMYKALFSLAYYGMMRVGELTKSDHTLKASDLHIGNNKDKILIILYTSKTHGKESKPQHIKISATKGGNNKTKFFCPFKLVLNYMSFRGPYKEGEYFFVFADGSPISGEVMRKTLRSMLKKIGLDSSLYDVHSFRAGRTCDLEKYGYSVDRIKSMGRWRSNAVYRYLKN